MEATEKALQEVLESWSKGAFTVQRVVYGNDENICVAIENTIWVSSLAPHFTIYRPLSYLF